MKKILASVVLALPLLMINPVAAESPLEASMQAFVVESDSEAREKLKAATEVEPDQVVEYQLTYTNTGKSDISGLTVVGPVPDGTSYLPATAATDVSASFLVSIDGGETFEREPVIRTVTQSNGEVVEVVVPAEQYTHVQWKAESPIGSSGGKQFYRYRVRVK